MKTATDIKKEYVNPSISILEVEANGMLLVGSDVENSKFETGDIDEMNFHPGESTSNPAL